MVTRNTGTFFLHDENRTMHCIATMLRFAHDGSHSAKTGARRHSFLIVICGYVGRASWQWHASSTSTIVAGLGCMQISDYPILIPSHMKSKFHTPCLECTLSRPHFESPLSCVICYSMPAIIEIRRIFGVSNCGRSTRVNNWSSNPMGAGTTNPLTYLGK